MIKNKVKKCKIFDIKYFGRVMLYSTVVGSLMIICFPMLYIVLASFKSGADLLIPPALSQQNGHMETMLFLDNQILLHILK